MRIHKAPEAYGSGQEPPGPPTVAGCRDGAAWAVIYVGLRIAAPFIRIPWPVLGSLTATVLFLLLPLLWLRCLSRQRIRPLLGIGLFVVLALVWSELLFARPFGLLTHIPWRMHPDALRVTMLIRRPIADLALISAAALLGMALASLISDPKMLLPVSLVGALVDYWGVYLGTTNAVIRAAPEFVRAVSAGIPNFGGGLTPQGLRPVSFVGFGDWLFLSMFLTVTARYNLRPRRTFWMLLAFLVPAMLLVLFGPLDYLPAVVPMALAIFIVNGRRLKLSREEAFATFYAILLVLAAIGVYTLITRHMGASGHAPR